MNFLENLWIAIGGIIGFLILFGCLSALFTVFGDVFRDHTLSGWGKAGWSLVLVFFPFLGVLLYLIFRGRGMDERTSASAPRASYFDPGNRYDNRYII